MLYEGRNICKASTFNKESLGKKKLRWKEKMALDMERMVAEAQAVQSGWYPGGEINLTIWAEP